MLLSEKEAIQASRRRNAAYRKLLRIDGMDSDVRLTALVIIDFLNAKSGYEIAWPSVRRLSERLGKSERTVKRYLATVRQLGIFRIHRFSPAEASAFLKRRYGLKVTFGRCRRHAPNLYEIEYDHPLWGNLQKLPPEVALSMAERSHGKRVTA